MGAESRVSCLGKGRWCGCKVQETQGYLEGDWNSGAPTQPWLAILESQRQGDVWL